MFADIIQLLFIWNIMMPNHDGGRSSEVFTSVRKAPLSAVISVIIGEFKIKTENNGKKKKAMSKLKQ